MARMLPRARRFIPWQQKRPVAHPLEKAERRPSTEEDIMSQLALVDSLTTSVPQRPRLQRIVRGKDLDHCRRSSVSAAVLVADLIDGHAVLEDELSLAPALRLLAADPRALGLVYGLTPRQRFNLNLWRFETVADWCAHCRSSALQKFKD
jgi:hypothetical protein